LDKSLFEASSSRDSPEMWMAYLLPNLDKHPAAANSVLVVGVIFTSLPSRSN
jgi:hypothetical protein